MGGADKVKRQHDGGRLTVRERIDRLVDKESFREIGTVAGKAEYRRQERSGRPHPRQFGDGPRQDRRTTRRGDRRRLHRARRRGRRQIKGKAIFIERYANQYRVPIVRMIEGSGGGGSVKAIETTGAPALPEVSGWEWTVEQHGPRTDRRAGAWARSRGWGRRVWRPRIIR